MLDERLQKKLSVLADAAKYDASCASGNAGKRDTKKGKGIGSLKEGSGICHSFTPDGRCISLLKILMTNYCIYDCQYCINRVSSNVQRARFSEDEIIDLTIGFYKRNYIEGLFLSSGIIQSPDYTMEAMVNIARRLRKEHLFRGYIHLKTIPNASPHLQEQAGWYADRLSINVELPKPESLKEYAPEKKLINITDTMGHLTGKIKENKALRKEKPLIFRPSASKKPPRYIPGGQSTQMIIGADTTNDAGILTTSADLYSQYRLRRVYYSAFSPIPHHSSNLPEKPAPLMREHRLYQADWLLRFYNFSIEELVGITDNGNLSLKHDPKLAWALKNRHCFPIDLNTADKFLLMRVPGLGQRSVKKILAIRKYHLLRLEDLQKMRIAINKVKPFVQLLDYTPPRTLLESAGLSDQLADANIKPAKAVNQLNLFSQTA